MTVQIASPLCKLALSGETVGLLRVFAECLRDLKSGALVLVGKLDVMTEDHAEGQ